MRAWRYMNVAHILCYIAVSSNYTNKNFLKPLNDKFQLLSPSDMGRVQAIGLTGPLAMREVLSWVLAVVQQEVDAGRVTPQEAVDLRKEVTQFRGSVGMLLATSEMPIPFVYVSFVLTICVLYPLFFTASVALGFNKNTNIYWLHEIVAAVCVALNVMFYVALAAIASKFMDPFGNDMEDLNVLVIVRNTILGSASILRRQPLALLNADAEMRMDASRDWATALRPAFRGLPGRGAGLMGGPSRRISTPSDPQMYGMGHPDMVMGPPPDGYGAPPTRSASLRMAQLDMGGGQGGGGHMGPTGQEQNPMYGMDRRDEEALMADMHYNSGRLQQQQPPQQQLHPMDMQPALRSSFGRQASQAWRMQEEL